MHAPNAEEAVGYRTAVSTAAVPAPADLSLLQQCPPQRRWNLVNRCTS